MSIDLKLLERLESDEKNSLQFILHLGEKSYEMTDVSIKNSQVPVNEPTSRGGVYFAEKFAYKMRGVVEDLSIVPLLTGEMLGPSTEFGRLRITTGMDSEKDTVPIEILANLTNSVQTLDSIQLHMIIVRLERERG